MQPRILGFIILIGLLITLPLVIYITYQTQTHKSEAAEDFRQDRLPFFNIGDTNTSNTQQDSSSTQQGGGKRINPKQCGLDCDCDGQGNGNDSQCKYDLVCSCKQIDGKWFGRCAGESERSLPSNEACKVKQCGSTCYNDGFTCTQKNNFCCPSDTECLPIGGVDEKGFAPHGYTCSKPGSGSNKRAVCDDFNMDFLNCGDECTVNDECAPGTTCQLAQDGKQHCTLPDVPENAAPHCPSDTLKCGDLCIYGRSGEGNNGNPRRCPAETECIRSEGNNDEYRCTAIGGIVVGGALVRTCDVLTPSPLPSATPTMTLTPTPTPQSAHITRTPPPIKAGQVLSCTYPCKEHDAGMPEAGPMECRKHQSCSWCQSTQKCIISAYEQCPTQ